MSFGNALSLNQPEALTEEHELLPEVSAQLSADRHAAMSERMKSLLGQARRITTAIRNENMLSLQGVAGDLDADAAPLMLKGMTEHFTVLRGGETLYPFYCHISADRMDQVWPNAQFELLALMRRIQDFNLYCQQALRDDALSVALHAPGTPGQVDRIIAGLALFAGYFENLVETQPFFDARNAAERGPLDYESLKATIDRNRLMALDAMMEPQRLDDYWPDLPWPHVGVEILRKPECGQQHIQHVYFPAVFARDIVAGMKFEQQAGLEAAA